MRFASTLWRTLPDNAINDFLNPLQIVAAGWRSVYEPEAVCFEETAGGVRHGIQPTHPHREPQLARGLPGARRAQPAARRASSAFRSSRTKCCGGYRALLVLARGHFRSCSVSGNRRETPESSCRSASSVAACSPAVPRPPEGSLQFGLYFGSSRLASVVGLVKGTCRPCLRNVEHATRGHVGLAPGWPAVRFSPGVAVLLMAGALTAGLTILATTQGVFSAVTALFWVSVGVLGYVYFAYPLVVTVLSGRGRHPVRQSAVEPSVCLFITANDEAAVIAAKLTNALALDYPRRKLEILVASDGSVDAHQRDRASVCTPRGQAPRISGAAGKDRSYQRRHAFGDRRDRSFLRRQYFPRDWRSPRAGPELRRRHRRRCERRCRARRRTGRAWPFRRPLLPLRALAPGLRVADRHDGRRRRGVVRDPAASCLSRRRPTRFSTTWPSRWR